MVLAKMLKEFEYVIPCLRKITFKRCQVNFEAHRTLIKTKWPVVAIDERSVVYKSVIHRLFIGQLGIALFFDIPFAKMIKISKLNHQNQKLELLCLCCCCLFVFCLFCFSPKCNSMDLMYKYLD